MTDSEYAIRPNKTQLKREMRALNDLGKELSSLPDHALKKIELGDELRSEVLAARKMSKGALQRQLRRIASLLQHEDAEAIRLQLERQKIPSKQQTAELHELESWRDQLIAGNDQLLSDLIDQYPQIDRQRIRQLVRNAQQEIQRQKPPKSARGLFQYLAELKRSTSVHNEAEAGQDSQANDLNSEHPGLDEVK